MLLYCLVQVAKLHASLQLPFEHRLSVDNNPLSFRGVQHPTGRTKKQTTVEPTAMPKIKPWKIHCKKLSKVGKNSPKIKKVHSFSVAIKVLQVAHKNWWYLIKKKKTIPPMPLWRSIQHFHNHHWHTFYPLHEWHRVIRWSFSTFQRFQHFLDQLLPTKLNEERKNLEILRLRNPSRAKKLFF